MICNYRPSGFAFAGNPVVLHSDFDGASFDSGGGSLTLSVGGIEIYTARFSPPLDIDISEIVAAHIGDGNYEVPEDIRDPIVDVLDPGTLNEWKVDVEAVYSGHIDEYSFIALPGGVSKQNLCRFAAMGKDAFDARFANYKGNFFLTTRTAGWQLSIRETELEPLYFLMNRSGLRLEFAEPFSGKRYSLSFDNKPESVYALDIDALRLCFVELHGVLPNMFDVYADDSFCCRIVVEMALPVKERHRLRFINSLGVFETFELTGPLSVYAQNGNEDENGIFQRYDRTVGDFRTERERIGQKLTITTETGVKRPDEIRFMMDMLSSQDVRLLDFAPYPIKVIPSVESLEYNPRSETPQSFSIKLEVAETETYIMQDIMTGNENLRPRIFSNQFSKQFN